MQSPKGKKICLRNLGKGSKTGVWHGLALELFMDAVE